MGGAFVAVADDATATAWNPAGLATAGPAGMTIGWHQLQLGNQRGAAAPGLLRQRATFTSLGTMPVGVSYGSLTVSDIGADLAGNPTIRTLQISQWGVSVLQSVLPDVVVGSTVNLLRAGRGAAPLGVGMSTAADALTAADNITVAKRTAIDLDLALMATAPKVRIGLMLKNLRSPNFSDDPSAASPLPRQGRLGVAFLPTTGVTLAMDVDLNTVDLTGGPRRMCAFGGEVPLGPRLLVRSGLRWSLKGARQAEGTIGASVKIRRALWLDGHYATGRGDEAREGGVALRVGI